jgi:hypothetical protein
MPSNLYLDGKNATSPDPNDLPVIRSGADGSSNGPAIISHRQRELLNANLVIAFGSK